MEQKPKVQHVIPSQPHEWSVRSSGSTRATKKFPTKREAVNFALAKARRDHSEMFVHRLDGTVEEWRSFLNTKSGDRD